MRLRNLYELAVAPGERKGFSLRLKKLEDLQMKIAEMQNTISNLKGTTVPDVLKKQMDDLIDAASMEKEKLYSEIESAEGRNKTKNGIPGNVLKLLKGIEKNSPTIMNAYRNTGKFLYRGIKSNDDALYGKPFDARRPKDSNADLNGILNKALAGAGFVARRDNTSFTSGTYGQASNYGTVYIFFPRDGFHFHYSKSIKDLVLDSGKINLLLDSDLVEKVRSILSTNWSEVDHYFSGAYSSSDFLSGYTYQSDIKGLQKAVADGKLPAELGKFQTIDDFVTPAKVVSQMEYDQHDLDGAINSGHEVMITGPYYALRADKFTDYVNKYIEMTKAGSVDITPDTPNEADNLDDKINSMLGQKPDGFLIGDWVQHKYETGIKGEVVNNFYTNDFLLVKTYEGKLELVKNSNATKIDAPKIPQYKIGDKLYIRSKGTKYSKFNDKYGKVASIDGTMVTIEYSSYSTATVPIMLTEPAPKYDSNHPSVGDTVHVTDGNLKGSYGVITYVSSYGDIDVEIDGDAESITKGSFTVIDPATKPVDNSPLKYDAGDFVEIIGDDTTSWAGYVGTIVKPGKTTSKVKIMKGDDGHGTPASVKISNNNINKISQTEHDSRIFKYDDIVTITGGVSSGKTGKIKYFYSTGSVEIYLTGGGYADVKINNINLSSNLSSTEPDDAEIKVNDKVEILGGLYKGAVGTVIVAGETGYISVELLNNTVNALRSELKKVKSDTPINDPGINVGDTVKIIDGDSAGSTGTIIKLGKGGTYYKPDDGSSEKEYQMNSSLEKVADTNIAENDTVKIKNGLFKGSVGVVKSFGDYGFVRITLDDKTVLIPNEDLEKVKLSTPIKSTAELNDKVKIISGNYDGQIGTIKYFGSATAYVDAGTGSAHIMYTNLEKVNIPDDDLIDLDDIDFETFDEPTKPPTTADAVTPDFKQGDKVKLKTGPNKGKTGKVHYVWMSLPVVDVHLDDGNFQEEVPYADMEAVVKQIKFKKNDVVSIKDGALYAGQNGKIRIIYPDQEQALVKFGNGQKAMYDFDSLELMSSSTEPETGSKFKIGDTLKVISGPVKDFEGTVSDIEKSDTGAYTYTVIINTFGKDTPFQFLEYELEKTKSERPKKEANKEFDQKAALKTLITKGKDSGQVSYAELNNVFPAGEVNAEQVADLMDMLGEMGIDIVDNTGLNQPSNDTPEQLLVTVTQPERKQGLIDIFKDPTAKLLIKNAVDSKYLSTEVVVKILNILGYDKYLDFVKPYLDLKGVVYG